MTALNKALNRDRKKSKIRKFRVEKEDRDRKKKRIRKKEEDNYDATRTSNN